jgi:hypothetical protein
MPLSAGVRQLQFLIRNGYSLAECAALRRPVRWGVYGG